MYRHANRQLLQAPEASTSKQDDPSLRATMDLKYRPEIDGLRALAVLPVILFHAGLKSFSGGFIGVDVFFVISGYLITLIITKDIRAGTFSFAAFYERRSRRILPALFLVIACCIPFAWLWMLPSEMKDFSASAVSVCIFVSNVLFWRQSGYFERAAELKPLLHTWSLAVEEQFYIFFPIALLLAWRLGRKHVFAATALATLLSFGLSEYGSRHHPSVNFYMLPTRAWELLTGALCALIAIKPSRGRDNSLSILGISGIAFSVFVFDESVPFPSVHALIPVLSTCAIILFANGSTLVGAFLSLEPLTRIGLLSYSAYLWHQPLFAFARIRSIGDPSHSLMLLLSGISLVLAYFSWRFVEIPARRRGQWPLPTRRILVCAVGAAGVIIVLLGVWGLQANGFPSRWPQEIATLDDRISENRGLSAVCEGDFRLSPECRTGVAPEVVLWGDSFAMHLLDGLLASKSDLSVVQFTQSVCGPLVGIAPISPKFPVSNAKKCLEFNDAVLGFVAQTPSLKYAVLSSPFSQFADDGVRVLTREGAIVPGKEVAATALRNTLETLKRLGVTPVIFAPPPSPGFDAGRCLVNAARHKEPASKCDFLRSSAAERQAEVRHLLEEVGKQYSVVWLDDSVCGAETCFASQGGVFTYRDTGHLSREGSARIGRAMNFYGLLVAATSRN